jgi:hypothetical protein
LRLLPRRQRPAGVDAHAAAIRAQSREPEPGHGAKWQHACAETAHLPGLNPSSPINLI